jgi:L-lactate dehydrogenase (cytochrome)
MSKVKLLVEIHGIRYDLSNFDHPGGLEIISTYANSDATLAFDSVHPIELLKTLPKQAYVGLVKGYKPTRVDVQEITNLSKFMNLYDFENISKQILTKSSFSYISSGGEDEITSRENQKAFKRILFKPRILRNVTLVNTSTVMQGYKTDLPFYISATAQVGKAHASGEMGLSRGSRSKNIIQMVPMLHTCSLDEIIGDCLPSRFWFQVYVNKDRDVVYELINNVISKGRQRAQQ